MAKAPKPKKLKLHEEVLQEIQAALGKADNPDLSKHAAKRLRETLLGAATELQEAIAALDPVKEPKTWFDPADSVTSGRLVAAALISQPRVPMELVQPAYGAGVYAIYYHGDHPAYAPISGTETPIYVGKADPVSASSKTPRDQGTKLSARLAEHRKTIRTVEDYARAHNLAEGLYPLSIADFSCRRLVTATHAQMHAERHLIEMFRPVWNSEVKICWGMSMHGDTTGRNNDRPPWHVLHPGVPWALRNNIENAKPIKDSRPLTQIMAELADHFAQNPAFTDVDHLIKSFLDDFAQDPMTAAAPVGDESVEQLEVAEDEVEAEAEASSDGSAAE